MRTTMPWKEMLVSSKYELIELRNFAKQIKKKLSLSQKDEEKVRKRIQDELGETPDRHGKLKSVITVSGRKISGLRHMKIGVANYRGGLVVQYRICEECLEHKYYEKSGPRCAFCDEGRPDRVILFHIHPRQDDYH